MLIAKARSIQIDILLAFRSFMIMIHYQFCHYQLSTLQLWIYFFTAKVELAGKQSTPILPAMPSQIITGGLPAGLVSSMSSRVMLLQTALGEQTSLATFRPFAPELEPVKFWKRMSIMSTRDGYAAQVV